MGLDLSQTRRYRKSLNKKANALPYRWCQLFCKDCKTEIIVGTKGTRVTGPRSKIYQCGKYNSNWAQLTYACGKWPTDEFREWDPQTKVNFF